MGLRVLAALSFLHRRCLRMSSAANEDVGWLVGVDF